MASLNFFSAAALLSLLLFVANLPVTAQETRNPLSQSRNSINAYVGLIEYNINYERNILQHPKSYSNLRLGFGHGQFFVAGEGEYINAAFVHLTKKENSHLEIDVGVKCMITNSMDDPKFSDTFLPDLFFGYRYEKPSGGIVFRFGLNYPTFLNAGIGYKF
jgi:hypothetical protein